MSAREFWKAVADGGTRPPGAPALMGTSTGLIVTAGRVACGMAYCKVTGRHDFGPDCPGWDAPDYGETA